MGKRKRVFACVVLIAAMIASLAGNVTMVLASGKFRDVQNAGKYYYKPIYWAVDKGITSGTSATTFSPNEYCTRAQIVTFLWKAAGSPTASKKSTFTDVAPGAWYARAVSWAVEKKITSGISSTRFAPFSDCTRAQAVTFIWHAAGSPSVTGASTFSDVPSSAWYRKSVKWAVKSGVTSGVSASRFAPNEYCTRGQIVTFLWKHYAAKTETKTETKTAKDLFAKFLANEIPAYESDGNALYFRDLQSRHRGYAYSGPSYTELDNDGENEMILTWGDTPVHTYYFDAKDGKVKIFVSNDSTVWSFHTRFRGAVWVGDADTSHGNRQIYTLYRYKGADKLVEQTELSAWYQGSTYNSTSDFEFGGKAITMAEFEKIKKEIYDGM